MKSTTITLLSISIFIFTGCGSEKVAHTTIINADKTHISHSNSKSMHKKSAPTYASLTVAKQQEFLSQINQVRSERRSCGKYGSMGPVKPLVWSDKLYEAAYLHSYDMAKSRHFGHDGSGSRNDRVSVEMGLGHGSKLRDRMRYTDYRWRAIGENIASGQQSTQEVMQSWLRSDAHCKNLMSENFTEVGMAYYQLEGQFQQPYWSQNFGRSI